MEKRNHDNIARDVRRLAVTSTTVAQGTVDRDQIALDAAHQIEALPSDLHEAQKTARIQLIVLSALSSTQAPAKCDLARITELRVFEHGGFRAIVDGVGGWGSTQLAAIENATANAKKLNASTVA